MAISGFTPTNALPPHMLASMSQPLGATLPGTPFGASAALGVQEKPGLLTRLRNAMGAAISELRGVPHSSAIQTLPLQATPVAQPAAKPAATAKPKFPKAKTWKDKAGNVREVGTGKVLKPAAGAARAATPATAATTPVGTLPSNAVQAPGATVYSFDQNGNPIAPTMQSLGMTPTMLQGLEGMAGAVDPDGPQVNATNQTNLGLGNGMGVGAGVPVLGQPIVTTAPTPASAGASTGGSQTVRNENVTDVASRNQGLGYGWGSGGWGLPFGGVATPAAPYGASMLGAGGRLF